MPGLSPEERKLYLSYIAVGGGSNGISKKELYHGLNMAGLELAQKQLLAVWKEVDVDNSGNLDFEEFCFLAKKFQAVSDGHPCFPSAGLLPCSLTHLRTGLLAYSLATYVAGDGHVAAGGGRRQLLRRRRAERRHPPLPRSERTIAAGTAAHARPHTQQHRARLAADRHLARRGRAAVRVRAGCEPRAACDASQHRLRQHVDCALPPYARHSSPPRLPGAGTADSQWRPALWRSGRAPPRAEGEAGARYQPRPKL